MDRTAQSEWRRPPSPPWADSSTHLRSDWVSKIDHLREFEAENVLQWEICDQLGA